MWAMEVFVCCKRRGGPYPFPDLLLITNLVFQGHGWLLGVYCLLLSILLGPHSGVKPQNMSTLDCCICAKVAAQCHVYCEW